MNFSKKLSVVAAAIPFLMVVGCDSSSSGESTVAPTPNEVEKPSVKDSSNVEPVEKDTLEKDSVAKDTAETAPTVSLPERFLQKSAPGCFQPWIGSEGKERIQTGLDNGSETSGYWFFYTDKKEGGKSVIGVPEEYKDDMNAVLQACGGFCVSFTINKGEFKGAMGHGFPYAGVGFYLSGMKDGKAQQVDASKMGGIVVAYTSSRILTVEMGFNDAMEKELGNFVPNVSLPRTEKVNVVEIPWSEFSPMAGLAGNKDALIITNEQGAKILASIRFKVQAEDSATGDFNIIGLAPYDPTCSYESSAVPPVISSSSSETPKSSSSVVPESSSSLASCDFENWYGGEDVARINTGYDAGFNNSGYWYLENDSIDGGKSVITWAAEPDPEGGLEPVLDSCGAGVCGKYTLDKGVLDYDPFVVIAFDLAGRDADGRAIPVDISGMRGIDIQFKSSHAATLELSLGEEMDKKIGYALPAYDLGKSSTGSKYASIPWSKFRQPSWAKDDQIISIDEAITSVASIRVKIQSKTGSEGEFNIMGIGRPGTLLPCCAAF